LNLLQEREQQVPESVQYNIRRYQKFPQWNVEDTGMLVYHYEKSEPSENYLELRFCVTGNVYCKQKDIECDQCKFSASRNCVERVESMDVMSFRFTPVQLSQFVKPRKNDALTEDVLTFTHASSFSKMLPLLRKDKNGIGSLLNNTYTGSLENIFINAQMQMLLLYSMDCMLGDKEIESFNCKFLATKPTGKK
jgi:hypothetical protein